MKEKTFHTVNLGFLFIAFASLVFLPSGYGRGPKMEAGAVILAERIDPVVFRGADDQKIDEAQATVGSIVPEGASVETGPGGRALLLLSNGTVVTVTENAKMKIKSFDQEAFTSNGKSMKDFQEELSPSRVLVDLEVGSLVVQTKKLSKKSSFEIASSVGTAGIRGTEFKMGFDSTTGIELDVTESTVAFTPVGNDRAVAVSAGNGLSVRPGGVAAPRPVNPAVALQITNLNARAQAAVASIPVSLVTSSMGEASRQRSEKAEGSVDSDGSPSAAGQGDSSRRGAALQMLENNLDLTQARKTGKVGDLTSRLARLGLTVEETRRFYALTKPDQLKLLDESGLIPKRILAIAELLPSDVDLFYKYSPEARARILSLPDNAFTSLLKQALLEGLVLETLDPQAVAHSQTGTDQSTAAPQVDDARALALGESLKDSTGSHVLEELLELSGGVLTDEVIRQGEVADRLLRDYQLGASDSGGLASLEAGEVLANPFYKEIASLYRELESDQSVAGSPTFFAGKNLVVESNSLALAPYFAGSSGKTFVLSAGESLSMEGDFSWADKPEDSARLVVMSAGEMKLAKGMTLQSATGDLILSSRSDMNLDGVRLEVSREALIRGMGDVSLVDTRIGADAMATVKAARNLNVDGLTFSRGVSNILMEATTIRLSNVDFPAASAVRLNSLKGPIDGRYPNFGTAIPAADQIGRVNFLKNVSSGGNQIMTRQAFDQFGKNITIGKTPGL